jgi:hypothetical protein
MLAEGSLISDGEDVHCFSHHLKVFVVQLAWAPLHESVHEVTKFISERARYLSVP